LSYIPTQNGLYKSDIVRPITSYASLYGKPADNIMDFLAISLCSLTEPVDFKSISQIADGINHAVPTENEMQSSISWLKK
jgi:hypothetical protein